MIALTLRRSLVAFAVVLCASLAHARQCLVTRVTADDAGKRDQFGESVALAGDTLFVAAPLDNVVGRNTGTVYVLQRDGLNWFQKQHLVPPDAHRGQVFGAKLATDGQTLVVLATRIFSPVGDGGPGELYVYERVAGDWTLVADLEPIGPPRSMEFLFGISLAMSDGWIFACESQDPLDPPSPPDHGSVHAYRRTALGWEPAGRFVPVDPTRTAMHVTGVAAKQNTLAITASGSVYVFERVGDEWVQRARLDPHDGPLQSGFGNSAAVQDDTILVGARGDSQVARFAGSAYVFEKRAGVWLETAKLAPSDLLPSDGFGSFVGIGDGTLVSTLGRGQNGVVFVFERAGSTWQEKPRLELPFFPWNLSVSGDIAVIGNAFDDQREPDAGAVNVYSLSGSACASLSSPRELSWGKQHLEIDRGPAHAGHFYWLGGSTSGTLHGVAYRGTRIPLNMDAYFRALVKQPNLGLFTNNFGVLDANGHASMVLKVPPEAYVDYVGLNVDHAFVEYGPQGFEHVSNAVSLRFGDRD